MKRIILINIRNLIILIVALEILFAIGGFYYKFRDSGILTFTEFVSFKLDQAQKAPLPNKFEKLRSMRNQGETVYPFYIYNPALNHQSEYYFLGNLPNSKTLYCNETPYDSAWSIFQTDRFGFRNEGDILSRSYDALLLGDSYVHGACVDDSATIAAFLTQKGLDIYNMGFSGTGPLYQLACLREYAGYIDHEKVIWVIFTGNDLRNLRNEKSTLLRRYLQEHDYQQGLAGDTSYQLAQQKFLEDRMRRQKLRTDINMPYPDDCLPYWAGLDSLEAIDELRLFGQVADSILMECADLGSELNVLILDHGGNDFPTWVQDMTHDFMKKWCQSRNVEHFALPRSFLREKKSLYRDPYYGSHFNREGYNMVADEIYQRFLAE